MGLRIPETPDEYVAYLEGERNGASSLRNEMNRHIGNERVEELREKRKFLQKIVITSATLLGFVSAFSVISESKQINHPYFIAGVSFHLFLICFVTLNLRETIDSEIEGLLKLQDRYSKIFKYQVELAQRYIIEFIHDQTNIFEKFKKYQDELLGAPSTESIKEENKRLETERDDRMNQKVELEYNAEITAFSFVCGTIFIFLSILNINFSLLNIVFGLLILFYLTFTDSLSKWLKYFFKFLTFTTRKNILQGFKSKG